jgi:glycosyltransferase involved in cell wall biosynthesis
MNKKVLIITYYWPPSGGSGVQRWLKFVKYLPGFGCEPYVFTPENPAFLVRDESLLMDVPKEAEIIRFPIWEPYEMFFRLSAFFGSKKSTQASGLVAGKKMTVFQKLSTWIRGNLFIPDPRVFWVRPSVRFLNDFLRESNIGTIITTGPPHSIHLIGYRLKKNNSSLAWIADFRDPWSEWGLLDSLLVGGIARNIHRKMESNVLRSADKVITITPFYVRRFEKLSGRKVSLLTNGYDEDDFKSLSVQTTKRFIIRHVGIVNEKCDPRPFLEALQQLALEHDEFGSLVQVDFVGDVHPQFKAFVHTSPTISTFTTFTPPVPHKELISMYGSSSLLLIILTGYKDAEGYMPGKLFEYIATGLPIIGIGPEDGDASALLKEVGVGEIIDDKEVGRIKAKVLFHFDAWKNGTAGNSVKAGVKYSRKEITRALTELL